jgi:hypothetical protein
VNPQFTIQIISYLFSFALLLQCIEMISISREEIFLNVWSFKNLKGSLPFQVVFEKIFSKTGFRFLLLFQFFLILISALAPARPLLILAIAFIHLIICIRFRGIFNGGSDMMVFIIASGLIIGGKIGLIYISIHTCYSYFKAGIAKILQPSWRSGIAINQFLRISLYSNIRKLDPHKYLSRILSYSVLGFELIIPIIFFYPKIGPIYFATAIAFHFINFLVFGLNRFLWIWLSAWPAVIYCTELIKF